MWLIMMFLLCVAFRQFMKKLEKDLPTELPHVVQN